MNAPFQYGTLATKENFVDRVEDRAQLKSFLSSHINVMLISPRRWGKSSLVKVATEELQNEEKDIRVCFIDAFSIGSEAEFYRTFASQVIACVSTKLERRIQDADTAIDQILRKQYPAKVAEYCGELLLVGINYDKKDKTHQCNIERINAKLGNSQNEFDLFKLDEVKDTNINKDILAEFDNL